MKSLLYIFRRYKLASVLNVLGLGIALAAFYLLMTQVVYNNSYNSSIKDNERIFRFEFKQEDWRLIFCRPFCNALRDLPHVESVIEIMGFGEELNVVCGDREFRVYGTDASAPGVEFFGNRLIEGNMDDWQNWETVLINESLAKKLFGKESAIGKNMKNLRTEGVYTVVGVYEDFPDNCTLKNGIYRCYGNKVANSNEEWSTKCYVRLDNAENKAEVERGMLLEYMKMFSSYTDLEKFKEESHFEARLTPVRDIYFSKLDVDDKGDRNLVMVVLIASVFVLLVALLNFTNFTLAVTPMRIRGINTRKVIGASAASLRCGMIMENVFLAAVAFSVAYGLVELFQTSSLCMSLVSGSVAFSSHPLILCAMALSAVAIGIISAAYPAWYATSFTPALVLKGSFGLSPQGRHLRMVMVFVQFIVAFVFTIYVLVMNSQSRYIYSADYGFNKDEVLFSDAMSSEGMAKQPALRNELQKLPFVESVAFGSSSLGISDVYMSWGRGDGDKHIRFLVIPVDQNYLKTMDIKVIEGRDFYDTDTAMGAFILNKCMMKKYKWLRVGKPIWTEGESAYPIVGVCDNINIVTMRQDNSTVAAGFIVMGPDMAGWGNRNRTALVRIAPGFDKIEAKRQLEKIIRKFEPSQACSFHFLDKSLESTYVEEFRFVSQVRIFTLICILITLIGVFCLTMFETECRRKEIAIRKIMGSTVGEALALFARRYSLPLVLSFIVAVPIGYYISMKWLQNFAQHTPLHWWIFPVAFLVVSAIVLATVVVQSWRVATMNPAEGVKTE